MLGVTGTGAPPARNVLAAEVPGALGWPRRRTRRRQRGGRDQQRQPAALDPVRVEVSGLTKNFGSVRAVDDLTFTVEPGQVTGFLGPNGAGKTTTLRMAARPDHPRPRHDARSTAPPTPPSPSRPAGSARCWRRRSTRPAPAATTCGCTAAAAGIPRRAGRRGARPGRARPRPAPEGRRLLPRHAAAARAGDRAARRPGGARARRAGQRAGPRGHPVAARLPAPPRRTTRAAPCWSPATCWPRWSRPPTGW